MLHRSGLGALVALVAFLACHTIHEELPAATGAVSGAPGSPTVIIVGPPPGTGVSTPTAPATPAPSTGTAPAPAPTATPAPAASSGCRLPPGTGSGNNCSRGSAFFLSELESALDQLVKEEPSLFNLNSTRGCGNCYAVRDQTRYVSRLPGLMAQRGLCATYDGEELAVKSTNSFNDQYDILTSDGFIRRQSGSYRSTCYPAWF